MYTFFLPSLRKRSVCMPSGNIFGHPLIYSEYMIKHQWFSGGDHPPYARTACKVTTDITKIV